jgi:hypothetical protein
VTFFIRLLALLAGTALVAGTLPSCAGSQEVATTLSQPLDSTIQAQVARQLNAGKVKIKAQAPVAAGASQAQDYTKAGQHGGALATEPGAHAAATMRTGVPPWLPGAGIVLLVFMLLAWLLYRFRAKLVGARPLP